MEKKKTALSDVFDETVFTETVFIRKDGKLMMRRRKVKVDPDLSRSERPMFPISKERR